MKGALAADVNVDANFVAGEAYFVHAESDPTPSNNLTAQMPGPQNSVITVWIQSASGTMATQKVQLNFHPFPVEAPVLPIFITK
jgi:hypothetical protein